MNQINKITFKECQALAMMEFLNSKKCLGNIISVCQAKNNDFTIFYWGE